MFELVDNIQQNAVIKVVGVGGGGGNAVRHMFNSDVEGVEFICANTDAQALTDLDARQIIQLGGNITKGLGDGANPEVGRQSALEDRDRIAEALAGSDMVFITAGMGGGTGTGAAPIVAEVARELGILTVAVVTKPFLFEGGKRMSIAEEGLKELEETVDSLITIPNEKLLAVLGKKTSLLDAFAAANDVRNGYGHDGYRPWKRRETRPGCCGSRYPQSAAGGHQPSGSQGHSGQHHCWHGSQPG